MICTHFQVHILHIVGIISHGLIYAELITLVWQQLFVGLILILCVGGQHCEILTLYT